MASPKTRKAKREYADYDLEIESWSWGYHFGLGHDRRSDDPYWEAQHLHLSGHLLSEPGLKYPNARVTIIPDRRYDAGSRTTVERKPTSAGSVEARTGELDIILSAPQEVLPTLVSMFAGSPFKFLLARGESLFRRRALVWSFSLETNVDEDDIIAVVEPRTHQLDRRRVIER